MTAAPSSVAAELSSVAAELYPVKADTPPMSWERRELRKVALSYLAESIQSTVSYIAAYKRI